jgi:hypothetical protein
MSEEIFVNTGTSFQQPYIARQPASGRTPAIGTVEARTPTNVQTPFTYSNRTPFTYRNPVNGQQPYIAQGRQPGTYARQGQTPITYRNPVNGQQPYIAQGRQPGTYARQGQTPFTYRNPVNGQTPYIANGQQPGTYARQGQTPYPYIANSQTPYIANSQTPFTYSARSPFISTTSQTITETNINNYAQAELEIYRSSSSNFINTLMTKYVKFVFSNGTTNSISGNTARKISLYMRAAAGPSSTTTSTPTGLFTGWVLMGEWETPSGFAPDSYSIEYTGATNTGSGTGQIDRTWDLGNPSGVTYGISKSFMDTDQVMTWGYTDSGFSFRSSYFTECYTSQKQLADNFALSFQKSGYPDIVVDTFRTTVSHEHTHTAGLGGCF